MVMCRPIGTWYWYSKRIKIEHGSMDHHFFLSLAKTTLWLQFDRIVASAEWDSLVPCKHSVFFYFYLFVLYSNYELENANHPDSKFQQSHRAVITIGNQYPSAFVPPHSQRLQDLDERWWLPPGHSHFYHLKVLLTQWDNYNHTYA